MSNSTFLVANIPETQNPNYSTYMMDINYDDDHHHQGFELSDYLALADHPEEDSTSSFTACLSQTPISQEITSGSSVNSIGNVPRSSTDHIKCKNGMKRIKMDVGYRIAFRTQSELEVMDDGYKWRKYGKKRVKNSPNPRNYYKCSTGGCNVKKRVERDGEDSSYVITTYEGVHNHESPCVVYYHEMPPFSLPTAWSTFHPSHSS